MSNQNRRPPSYSFTTSSSLAKRHASSSENFGKPMPPSYHMAKKRAPLGNITNHKNVAPSIASSNSLVSSSSALVQCATKTAKANKGGPAYATTTTGNTSKILPTPLNVNSNPAAHPKEANLLSSDGIVPRIAVAVAVDVDVPASSSWDTSPSKSDAMSVSMDETMSSCYSLKSPEVEYVDKTDIASLDSSDRNTFKNLNISDKSETIGNVCSRDSLIEMEIDNDTVNVDSNYKDPQFCATYACDIYKHLRASEAKKRPAVNYMERVQKDINTSMRAILIDWLVEVAEEYRLVPDTLYLTVNYIDRYLSGNAMNRQSLQLLGVACMMIASKYEEICAPQVEEFCYITDNTYFKDEVLQMESSVLNYLKFEMTAPTVKCFLRRFTRAAQGITEVPSLQLECLTNYIAELSLLEYSMLSYAPSLIAASAIFLARFILYPSRRPWNSTLQHYTLYQPSDLCASVKDLHRLCCGNHSSSLPSVSEKYSQHKYKYVAKKYCPPSIPPEYFRN